MVVKVKGRVGPSGGAGYADGTEQDVRQARTGASVVTDAHARYQEAILRGNVYAITAAAATPSAYSGGAAGTPLVAIHNPAGSGKAAVALAAALGITTDTTATTTGTTGQLEAYIGPSALPTGTVTSPLNMLTGLSSGSQVRGFSNAALTGSTALTFAMALLYFSARSNATVIVAEQVTPTFIELAGSLVAIPGNEIAIGWRAVPTGLVNDLTLLWEEVPYP